MINSKGELVTSIPSKCKYYEPIKDKPSGVKCEKLVDLYQCKNHEGERVGCLFCKRFAVKDI